MTPHLGFYVVWKEKIRAEMMNGIEKRKTNCSLYTSTGVKTTNTPLYIVYNSEKYKTKQKQYTVQSSIIVINCVYTGTWFDT